MFQKKSQFQKMNKGKALSQPWLLCLFLLLALIWGATFLATKVVGNVVPATHGSGYRLLLSLIVLHLVFRLRRASTRIPKRDLPAAWINGILIMAIPYICMFFGMRYISSGLGGIIEGSMPIFVVLASSFMLKCKASLTSKTVCGLSVGFIGLLLVFADKIEFQGSFSEVLGVGFILVNVIAFATGTVISRKLLSSKKLNIHALLYQQNLASLLFIVPLMLAVDGLPSWQAATHSLPTIFGILFLGIFPTAMANYIYSLLVREWGSVRAGAVGYLIPVVAILLDYLVYGHVASLLEIAGGVTILVGVALLQPSAMMGRAFVALRSVWKRTQLASTTSYPSMQLEKVA